MRGTPRRSLAFTISSLLHATVILWGQWNFAPDIDLEDPGFELLEVEMLDPDAVQGLQGDPESPDTLPPPEAETPPSEQMSAEELEKLRLEEEKRLEEENRKKAEEEKRKQEEAEKKAAEEAANKQYANRGSTADDLSPPTSNFHALLIPKRIRKLPFAEKAADMLAPWPDFELIVSKGGFDPLRDFEYIVIASPNIRDWRQTFLAVEYTMTREQMQAGIERAVRRNGEVIEWRESADGILSGNPRPADESARDVDERWFVLLPDNVAVYVHRAFLPNVLAGPKGEDKTSGNFVANLTRMKRYAARQPTSGFQLKVTELMRAFSIRRPPQSFPLDRLNAAELSVEAAKDPRVVIRMEFADLVSAKKAELFWKETVKQLIDDNLATAIFVRGVYDDSEFERQGNAITIRAQLSEVQIEWALDAVGSNLGKLMKKTPEELEKQRQERLDNWEKRNSGKLGPGALDEPEE